MSEQTNECTFTANINGCTKEIRVEFPFSVICRRQCIGRKPHICIAELIRNDCTGKPTMPELVIAVSGSDNYEEIGRCLVRDAKAATIGAAISEHFWTAAKKINGSSHMVIRYG